MKKHFKYLAAAGLIAALFLSAGCVDDAKDKKPAPETNCQGLFHQIQKEVTFCGLLHGAYA